MKYSATLTPTPGTALSDLSPLIVPEERAVWAAYESGVLREMYIQPDPLVVTLIYEAADKEAVALEVEKFPMVAAKLLSYQITALGHWSPLKALFGDQANAS